MVFTSFHFLAFFFVTITLGHLLKNRTQKLFLLAASYYFYGAFEPWYLLILWGSSSWDYLSALGMRANDRREQGLPRESILDRLDFMGRRGWLFLSLAINISILAYFKYTNFGIEVLNDVHPLGGTMLAWPSTNILLPIGISFFTFQSMSYIIDVYRRVIEPRKSYIDYSMYICFFPHMVAGPIVRSKTFFAGLDNRFKVTRDDMVVGMTRIMHGFFRKLVLADNLAPLIDKAYGSHMTLHTVDVWIAAVAFAWQIYLDFAGYSDIARGVARLFGIEFEINFLYPFAASSIEDHWKRWHLSFTTWIRDYIYIPLGGSRLGEVRTYINIFIIWFFAGVWHGAAYHFIAWGLWQGLLISIHREYAKTRVRNFLNNLKGAAGISYNLASRIVTFFFLTFGFIYFRAETMTKSTQMQGRLFGVYDLIGVVKAWKAYIFSGGAWADVGSALAGPAGAVSSKPLYLKNLGVLVLLYFTYEFIFNKLHLEYFWKPENKGKLAALLIFFILCIIGFAVPEAPSFIYFQF